MGNYSGFVQLKTAKDLLGKLRHDLARMQAEPSDSYAAFDFFVTAESLCDWRFPDLPNGKANPQRAQFKHQHKTLQLVDHLASGAKHFETMNDKHESVSSTGLLGGSFDADSFCMDTFSPSAFSFGVVSATLADGTTRSATELAEEVIVIWEKELGC